MLFRRKANKHVFFLNFCFFELYRRRRLYAARSRRFWNRLTPKIIIIMISCKRMQFLMIGKIIFSRMQEIINAVYHLAYRTQKLAERLLLQAWICTVYQLNINIQLVHPTWNFLWFLSIFVLKMHCSYRLRAQQYAALSQPFRLPFQCPGCEVK